MKAKCALKVSGSLCTHSPVVSSIEQIAPLLSAFTVLMPPKPLTSTVISAAGSAISGELTVNQSAFRAWNPICASSGIGTDFDMLGGNGNRTGGGSLRNESSREVDSRL